MKQILLFCIILFSVNLFAQSIFKNKFITNWEKQNSLTQVKMLNDYIIESAHYSTDSIILKAIDSCYNRNFNKSYFIYSNGYEVSNYFINLYIMDSNYKYQKCLYNFISASLLLLSLDQQTQIFENKIQGKYLEERNSFRIKLSSTQLERLCSVLILFWDKRNDTFITKQVYKLYQKNYEVTRNYNSRLSLIKQNCNCR